VIITLKHLVGNLIYIYLFIFIFGNHTTMPRLLFCNGK